jgi:redox-sensing transcriptional repressor
MKKNGRLNHAMIERLMHYYYFLSQRLEEEDGGHVTSAGIARPMHMDDTLVRKDLAAIGVRGYPRTGYRSAEVLPAIRCVLGFDEMHRAVIIGAGRLGGALASYRGFAPFGIEITGVFDIAPHKAGLIMGNCQIQPMSALARHARERKVDMAILTVPRGAVEEAADAAIRAGIRALWNFASASLEVPEGILVRNEHIALGLAELSCELARRDAG